MESSDNMRGNVGPNRFHIIILRKYWYQKVRGLDTLYMCRTLGCLWTLILIGIANRPQGCVRSLEKACVQVQPGILALLRYG